MWKLRTIFELERLCRHRLAVMVRLLLFDRLVNGVLVRVRQDAMVRCNHLTRSPAVCSLPAATVGVDILRLCTSTL